MAGIEKITNEIAQQAEKEAAEIISAAEESAKNAKSKAQEECDAIKNVADEKLSKKMESENKKTESQCEQAEKLILLKAKQDIIDSMLVKAKTKILLQDNKEYFDTILKLLEKQALADKGEMLLNDKDLKRIPDDFEMSVNDVATKCGGMLSISKETVNIDGGFILKYGNIEINSSIDAIFEENEEELVDVVNNLLW